jgi:hypothetical protein
MKFDATFVIRGYVKKLQKLIVPCPAVDIGKSNTKETKAIELLFLEISLSQISCLVGADFVFICVLTSFMQTAIIP